MLYMVLADLVVLFHFTFVLFVIGGGCWSSNGRSSRGFTYRLWRGARWSNSRDGSVP